MRKQEITFNSYLIKILVIAALFVMLPMLFGSFGELNTTLSYLRSCVVFFILTLVSINMLLGKEYIKFYSIAFFVQLLIGLVHYLGLIAPNYFMSDGRPVELFWGEYHSVYDSVDQLVNSRANNSFIYFDSSEWNVTHGDIWRIITIPFTFLENKWLNYSPFNVFSSLLASANLILAYNYLAPNNTAINTSSTRKLFQFAVVYFPLFLLNDTLWRDAFGVALISIGLILTLLSTSFNKKIISLIILVYVSYLLRNVYVVIVGFVFAQQVIKTRKASTFLYIPIVIVTFFLIILFYQSKTSEEYAGMYVNQMSILALPLKIVMGVIGPFPWTQFMMTFAGRVQNAYQLSDYILGVFQFGFLIAIISEWKHISFRNLDCITIMGFGVALSGFISNAMHIGYIAEGVFFTLPWFFLQVGTKYKKYFRTSFLLLLLLNVLVVAIGGLGISNIWR